MSTVVMDLGYTLWVFAVQAEAAKIGGCPKIIMGAFKSIPVSIPIP